jgi:probable F420-dependent oxidoreductase
VGCEVKIGLFLPTFRDWADLSALRRLVGLCEERGVDSVWIPDRVAFPVGDDERAQVRPMSTWLKDRSRPEDHWGQHGGGYRADQKVGEAFRDVYVVAGLVAAMTDRLEIGTSVALVPHRNPVATARAVATLDELTGGRFRWGVGTGHVKGEYDVLHLDYDRRQALLAEWLDCMVALWSADPATFAGETWQVADLRMLLPRTTAPHPPILIGGNGKRALRLSARLGGGWIPAYLRPDEVATGIDFLRAEMEEGGHHGEPTTVLLSRLRLSPTENARPENSRPVYTPDVFAEQIEAFAAAGCETLVAHVPTRGLSVMEDQVELLAQASAAVSGRA